jgi:hypothetical protein
LLRLAGYWTEGGEKRTAKAAGAISSACGYAPSAIALFKATC